MLKPLIIKERVKLFNMLPQDRLQVIYQVEAVSFFLLPSKGKKRMAKIMYIMDRLYSMRHRKKYGTSGWLVL